jgi:hypothetical protein
METLLIWITKKSIEQKMHLKKINNLLQQFQHINIFHAMDKVYQINMKTTTLRRHHQVQKKVKMTKTKIIMSRYKN